MCIYLYISVFIYIVYYISSNECLVSNKRCPLIRAAPLGIKIEISTKPLDMALIGRLTIFY